VAARRAGAVFNNGATDRMDCHRHATGIGVPWGC